jgi:asparagine synthase (glutamine-hydrolysing)
MCGIAGIWNESLNAAQARRVVHGMAESLIHRGPDDDGCWAESDGSVALAHRRLSIVDLSPLGRQPMVSVSGRYAIVFNGEVYNHLDLKRELTSDHCFGGTFRGSSDTEVMLAAIDAWGLRSAVERFIGMFAFALWDRRTHRLFLVRDRLGIKPLYYGWAGKAFLFGSELRALATHPDFRSDINRDALALLMRHNCIPAPHCIYNHVYKLLPGTILSIGSPNCRDVRPVPFWSARETAERGLADPFCGTEVEAIDQLDLLLREAVGLRMVADVPLGAFLSGGVDSSTVVALMQAQSDRPIKTFSIGSLDDNYDEARYAREVARHLGTDHTELYVSAQDALTVVPHLPTLYDEPFSDSSQIPTYLVSKLAREHVTIALSGDGGDELFAGYNRHVWGQSVWNAISWMPPLLRQMTARAIDAVSPQVWDRLFDGAGRFIPMNVCLRGSGDKLHKIAQTLSSTTAEAFYRTLASHWSEPECLVLGAKEPLTSLTATDHRTDAFGLTNTMLYLDLVTYLPDDILTKVDRASMAVSLEARVPLLDHRVVEFAWRIPLSMKLCQGRSKWLLRQVLNRYVPARLIERPKAGFGVPIGAWLRGPLRPWAEALLDAGRLRREGFFNPIPVRQKWLEHLAGRKNWEYHLWDVLMFQAWHEQRESVTVSARLDDHVASGHSCGLARPLDSQTC